MNYEHGSDSRNYSKTSLTTAIKYLMPCALLGLAVMDLHGQDYIPAAIEVSLGLGLVAATHRSKTTSIENKL